MNRNFLEMIDGIKMEIFAGDHSGIYMLACAVACIAASFGLITWYNKMLNDPYGRLDMRSIIRTVIVLFLTCNFYSFVLIPFDYMTGLVAKGISASVSEKRYEYNDRVARVYADVEEADKTETLKGEFSSLVSDESTSTSLDSGLSGESNAISESEAEESASSGQNKSFWQRAWDTIKMAATIQFKVPMENIANILSWLISLIIMIIRWILMSVSSVYLIILGLIGPFTFALSLIPGFKNNVSQWIARYIQISFWIPMCSLIDFVNFKMKDAVISFFLTCDSGWKFLAPFNLILLDVSMLVCLLAVPSLCAWIIVSSGASEVNSSVINTGAKALMLKGK